MRKVVFLVVQTVGNMFRVCGDILGLFSAVKNTLFGGVYKNRGLYETLQVVVQELIHLVKLCFSSVGAFLLHTIHKTYNKLQLININNIVVNTRRIK